MTLLKFVTFVVLMILDNLVSMQNSLNADNEAALLSVTMRERARAIVATI